MKIEELDIKILEVHEELLNFGKGKGNALYSEIAKRAGVSIVTVFRVMRGRGGLYPTKKTIYDECTLLLEERKRALEDEEKQSIEINDNIF